MKASNILFFLLAFLFVFDNKVSAQTAQFMPDAMIAEPGEQKTNNLSTGSSASLRVGTSSSFGTSANVSTSEGFDINSKSTLDLLDGKFSSRIGDSSTGKVSVDVGNVRSAGSGFYQNDKGLELNADDALSAEANAEVTGIFSETNIDIDPSTITFTEITPKNEIESNNPMETANGGAGKNLNNSLNVDITNNNFTNAFSQAF
tara:strand:- start:319 stop:927 length:609 start_codon:yes stop_codon:yes gene_type:complete